MEQIQKEQFQKELPSHMEYMEGMEQIQSDIFDKVISAREDYQAER